MRAEFKIPGKTLEEIRLDLKRPHPFAHERVGFLTAGIVGLSGGNLILLCREYRPIDDTDYLRDPSVGAMIGPDAMRKGLQTAYGAKSALFHVHSHGGRGIPDFSSIDLRESATFVPSFFNVIPQMAHGIIVLSNDSARGLMWLSANLPPVDVTGFMRIGAPLQRFGALHELA